MNNLYTAVTKKDGNWWIGWVLEIPGVNCQEKTHEKLLESLKITLKEALKFNRIGDQQFQDIMKLKIF